MKVKTLLPHQPIKSRSIGRRPPGGPTKAVADGLRQEPRPSQIEGWMGNLAPGELGGFLDRLAGDE